MMRVMVLIMMMMTTMIPMMPDTMTVMVARFPRRESPRRNLPARKVFYLSVVTVTKR